MAPPLTDDVGFLLSRASGVIIRTTNAALAAHGLRVRAFSVLALADDLGSDGISQREVAELLGLDPSQVVALVDELEDAGFVTRRVSDRDRRTRQVVVTERGAALRRAAGADADAALEGPLAMVGVEERERLRDLLTRIWTTAR